MKNIAAIPSIIIVFLLSAVSTAVMLTLRPLCADRNLRKQRSVGL